jgi:hypothetical protein
MLRHRFAKRFANPFSMQPRRPLLALCEPADISQK